MEYDVDLYTSFDKEMWVYDEDGNELKKYEVVVDDYYVEDDLLIINIDFTKIIDNDPERCKYDTLFWTISGPLNGCWDDDGRLRLCEVDTGDVGDVQTVTLEIEIAESGSFELGIKIK